MSANDVPTGLQSLYTHNHGWLHGWLRRRLGNAVDAADLAHDTFIRILVSGRLPGAEQSRAHLTQVAKGLVIDMYRRRSVEAAYLDALGALPQHLAPSPEERALALEALLLLDAALGRLPARARETFLLSQLDGLTYSAIAAQLSISVGSVRNDMLLAMRACHAALDDGAA